MNGFARLDVLHLLVVLPGIGGSVLRQRGELLWGISAARRPVRAVRRLADPDGLLLDPEYDDGVHADGFVGLPVSGLTRLLGYSAMRRCLRERFALNPELNLLEFSYDWRRPIAQNAARLSDAVTTRLKVVRERLNPDAEVVLVGHSMGGLVAREYVEHLDGDAVCRKLITLGSPFRGSVKALDFLVNGPKLAVRYRQLAEPLGQIPSIYELLPIYPVVHDGTALCRVEDLTLLDSRRVKAAREFLLALNESKEPARTEALAGFGPSTPQQAVLDAGTLQVSASHDLLPADYGSAGGDGTVPLISARPRSHTQHRLPVRYDNQSHGSLVTGRTSLDSLLYAIGDAFSDRDPVLGSGRAQPRRSALFPHKSGPLARFTVGADVADFYAAEEPVLITGRAERIPMDRPLWALCGDQRRRVVPAEDGSFEVDLGVLPRGLHRLDFEDGPAGSTIISDLLEVC